MHETAFHTAPVWGMHCCLQPGLGRSLVPSDPAGSGTLGSV